MKVRNAINVGLLYLFSATVGALIIIWVIENILVPFTSDITKVLGG